MVTNLVLQGPHAAANQLRAIAVLAAPVRVTVLSATALRCEDVAATPEVVAAVQAAALAAQVDATVIEAGRTLADFSLVAMDMDSTLITIECIDEIADMQGLKAQVSEITEAAMRGELDFAASLTRRVALLAGLDAAALERVYEERLRLSPGAETMLAAVRAAGLKTLLVSGGFTFFTDRLKARLGLDYTHANVLEIEDGRLTGRVVGGIVDAEEKMRTVQRVCDELGVPTSRAIVMGDGANDLKMMGIGGLSVAFRAKPVVRAQADVALNFSGLDGVLAVLG
ncbi:MULTISPECIES: phosphoserine phosphatase SerB [unclassified Massilia]|uniref:phosphoserine phosphatase SerB n=1 Tax=unclassified Massilia TaxID=2609279 RepID=UPI00178569C8|nr:phosphoserine phosphatase SerB [Massilia sp. CFBP 13647]MBD8672857.1 phosphoserine phosphatase SerB [Massilia sp. CFBP 13721]